MMKRMFASEPGQIRFTEDFREQTRGNLVPGQPIYIEFADVRIPAEPSGHARLEAWVLFDDGPATVTPLHLRSSWRDIDPKLTEAGEGNFWCGTVTPPDGARQMSVWFVKTGPSGAQYYDSGFGQNYWFRFLARDIRIADAKIDEHGFRVNVDAAQDVASISLIYTVLNRGLVSGNMELHTIGSTTDEMRRWTGTASIDVDAVISFDVVYTAGGRRYTDDNQRRHYTVPDPETMLAERRAALPRT